jgi:hypothetical protein
VCADRSPWRVRVDRSGRASADRLWTGGGRGGREWGMQGGNSGGGDPETTTCSVQGGVEAPTTGGRTRRSASDRCLHSVARAGRVGRSSTRVVPCAPGAHRNGERAGQGCHTGAAIRRPKRRIAHPAPHPAVSGRWEEHEAPSRRQLRRQLDARQGHDRTDIDNRTIRGAVRPNDHIGSPPRATHRPRPASEGAE